MPFVTEGTVSATTQGRRPVGGLLAVGPGRERVETEIQGVRLESSSGSDRELSPVIAELDAGDADRFAVLEQRDALRVAARRVERLREVDRLCGARDVVARHARSFAVGEAVVGLADQKRGGFDELVSLVRQMEGRRGPERRDRTAPSWVDPTLRYTRIPLSRSVEGVRRRCSGWQLRAAAVELPTDSPLPAGEHGPYDALTFRHEPRRERSE